MLVSLLVACFRPPDLPYTPREVPILVSDAGDPWHRCAPDREARVACTLDGDTLDISGCGGGAERIRLLGINAPEIEHPGQPEECYGPQAGAELARLLNGRTVTLSFDRVCHDVFVPPRTLAYVWLDLQDAFNLLDPNLIDDVLDDVQDSAAEPRVLINEYLLLAGWVKRYDEDWVEPLYRDPELIAAERLAQVRGTRLWSACDTP